jgi:hypothetical protein
MKDATLISTGGIAAVWCATPMLVIALGMVGLGAAAGYVSYVPALAVLPWLDRLRPLLRWLAPAGWMAEIGEGKNG